MIVRLARPSSPLSGTIRLPGDKSISHRYAMLAAVASGESRLRRFGSGQDCTSTLRCLQSLGVEVSREARDEVRIAGRSLRGLAAPAGPLDAGNSGTTMRLLSGILAGYPFTSTLEGDSSLSRRPMGRIVQPLRMMGASVQAQEGDLPPLTVRGGSLRAIRYELPVASAQVKSCILLAGLYAAGTTAVREVAPTRDHTEIALRSFGASVRSDGEWIFVEPDPELHARDLEVPADVSGASFFIIAAAMVPGSEVLLPGVGLNPRRRALVDYLRGAGACICIENELEASGEPRADLRVRYDASFLESRLPAIHGPAVPALIDEIPALAVLGSQTAGGLVVTDARELRLKESDRVAALARNLRALGARVQELPDGLHVCGAQRLRGAAIDPHGDHRIAMAFAVAGLAADGETVVADAECADVSFPGFWQILASAAGASTGSSSFGDAGLDLRGPGG